MPGSRGAGGPDAATAAGGANRRRSLATHVWGQGMPAARSPTRRRAATQHSLAEAFHIALRRGRQTLARQRTGLGSIHYVFERTRDQHLADARTLRGHPCHLIQHGKSTVDLVAGNTVQLDGSSEVLPEAGIEEVVVIPNLETGLGEEVGKILLEILVNALKTGSSIASGGPALGGGGVCA